MTAQGDRRALTLAALAFVGAALAATGGAVPLATEGSGGWFLRPLGRRSREETTELADRRAEPLESTALDAAGVLAQVVAILVIAVLIFVVARKLMRTLAATTPDDPFAAPDLAPPTDPRPLTEAVDDGLAVLAAGPVDDVIIACWVRLEAAAAAGGVTRVPSETSTELAVRMLARFDVPAEPVEQLLALYRAARYSRHRLGENDRTTAITALREIGAAMAVRA